MRYETKRRRDERRPLVDGRGERLRVGLDVHHLRAAQLLRVRDLADGRELVLGDDDPVALAVEVEAADERADRRRDGRLDRHLVGRGVEQPANAARIASARSTQWSHSAPCASQPSRYSSYAARTASESAPCEHELT